MFGYRDTTVYDELGYDETFNSGIHFHMVQAIRYSSEKFCNFFDAYDRLVEIVDSEWLTELIQINKEILDAFNAKHYAIYLDSNGLYEFISSGFEIL